MENVQIPFLVLIVMAFSTPALADDVYASWGCPTADGPLSIAKAFRNLLTGGTDDDIGIAAQSNGCSVFPYSVPVEPVQFIVETEDAKEIIYVWKVRFAGSKTTFFSNFDEPTNTTFMDRLGEPL